MRMNLNEFKRKYFFLIDKLQISRTERIAFTLIFIILATLFLGSFFIEKKFNFSQEKYDQILAEFERKSAIIEEEKRETEQRFFPPPTTVTELIAEVKSSSEILFEEAATTGTIESDSEAPKHTLGEKINVN